MLNLIKVMAVSLLILIPLTSHASSAMEELFTKSTTLQVNQVHEINTPTRTGMSFGGASFRVKQTSTPLANFTPPHLSSGCGGIDFFAGSFSIINSDQLVQMGRAIAQGVPSYAFSLALDSICPSCGGLMSRLQAKLEKFNDLAANGCEAAVGIIGETFDSELDALQRNMKSSVLEGIANPDKGWLTDSGETYTEKGDTDNVKKKADKNGVEVEGNVASDVLNSANITNYTNSQINGLNGEDLKELIMSLTGSFVIASNGDEADDNPGITTKPLQATFTIADYINGKEDGKLTFYVCDESIRCLNPTKVERDHKGLRELYKETAERAVTKILTRAGELSSTEKGLQSLSNLSFQSVSNRFKYGSTEKAGDLIATAASLNVVDSLLDTISKTVTVILTASTTDNKYATGMHSSYKTRLTELKSDFKEYKASAAKDLRVDASVLQVLALHKED